MHRKILCTLGPASLNERTLRRFDALGVDLFRINLSHVGIDEVEPWIREIRKYSSTSICLDTQGAQIRTGSFAEGRVVLEADATIELTEWPVEGNENLVPLYPPGVVGDLKIGDLLSVDFDSALLQVVETGSRPFARVLSSGPVGSNKAVALDRTNQLPPLSDVDRRAIALGRQLDIRHVALSFANRREDIDLVRRLAGDGAEIIAKIETTQAVRVLDDILAGADAILIDRGDLSREVPLQQIPFLQKQILRDANRAGVPVYVATNLLESMVKSSRPTRAEVNDVVNTLLDGANGLVLAAETAIGQNPIGCVSMIRSLIEFVERSHGPVLTAGTSQPDPLGSRLVAPHGGTLVRCVAQSLDSTRVSEAPKVEIGARVRMDVRQLAMGAFSPLTGFMDRETLSTVLSTHRLPDGTVWPMPVLLQAMSVHPGDYRRGEMLALTEGGTVRALLRVSECFEWEPADLASAMFGTRDPAHPGVRGLIDGGNRFLAGVVELLPEEVHRRERYELTPVQARATFSHRGWERIVGFHTRNVPHRAHELLQLSALATSNSDGVFVHPVVGPKKAGDFTGEMVLKAYQVLIRDHYPPNSAIVAGWTTYARYAGPREALFTALVRQNFGCSHFIIGRDHTGVADFYPPTASRRLCESLAADVKVEFIYADEIFYCQRCGRHVSACGHGQQFRERISASVARDTLRSGRILPDWFMREQVSHLILDELRSGHDVFVA